MTYDAGDKDLVRKTNKKAQLQREREVEDFRALLAKPGNRAVIWRILSQCGIYHDNLHASDLGQMARQEGKRSIGLWLLTQIFESDPSAFERMRTEATSQELSNLPDPKE